MKRLFFLVVLVVGLGSAAHAQPIPGSSLPLATPSPADVIFGIHGGTLGVGGTTSKFLVNQLLSNQTNRVFNIMDPAYGATGNGSTDDSTAIFNAFTAAGANGGEVYIPCFGRFLVNGATALSFANFANILMRGCASNSQIVMGSALTGPALAFTGGNNITVEGVTFIGATANTATNVAQPALQDTNVYNFRVVNQTDYYINGPMVKALGTPSGYPFGVTLTNLTCRQCGPGFVTVDGGTTTPSRSCACSFTNLFDDTIQVAGDAMFLHNIHDITINGFSWSYQASLTGNAIHLKGDVGPFMATGLDGGGGTTGGSGSYAFLAEADAGNTPARIMIANSIFEISPEGISITAGQQYGFVNDVFEFLAGSGSTDQAFNVGSGVNDVRIADSTFNNNGGGASTFYDINVATTSPVLIHHNRFIEGNVNILNSVGSNALAFTENTLTTSGTWASTNKPSYFRFNTGTGTIGFTQDLSSDTAGNLTGGGNVTATAFLGPGNITIPGIGGFLAGGTKGTASGALAFGNGSGNVGNPGVTVLDSTTDTAAGVAGTCFAFEQLSVAALLTSDCSGNVGTLGNVKSVAGVCPGNGTTVGTACYYSGTGVPTFSAPNGSSYLRYDGTTGSRLYYNTSGASTSGTTWSAQAAP